MCFTHDIAFTYRLHWLPLWSLFKSIVSFHQLTCVVKECNGSVVVGECPEVFRFDLNHGRPRKRHIVLHQRLCHGLLHWQVDIWHLQEGINSMSLSKSERTVKQHLRHMNSPAQPLVPYAVGQWSVCAAWWVWHAQTHIPAPEQPLGEPTCRVKDCSCPDLEHWRNSPWGN